MTHHPPLGFRRDEDAGPSWLDGMIAASRGDEPSTDEVRRLQQRVREAHRVPRTGSGRAWRALAVAASLAVAAGSAGLIGLAPRSPQGESGTLQVARQLDGSIVLQHVDGKPITHVTKTYSARFEHGEKVLNSRAAPQVVDRDTDLAPGQVVFYRVN